MLFYTEIVNHEVIFILKAYLYQPIEEPLKLNHTIEHTSSNSYPIIEFHIPGL